MRRPPRGVRKSDWAARDFFDVWLPNLAPGEVLLKRGLNASGTRGWKAFERAYRREMSATEPKALISALAALSAHADFAVGCYCADEAYCHRSILRRLLREAGADVG